MNKKPLLNSLTLTKKGFTLIEILIATSILVVVFTIGFVIFSMIMNSYYQAKAITRTSQAGRYVIEALSREARLADSFSVEGVDDDVLNVTNQNKERKQYFVSSSKILFVQNLDVAGNPIPDTDNPLTDSSQVEVTYFSIDKSYTDFSTTAAQQPFISIKFTLNYTGEKSDKYGSTQTFQTTVTSQKYNDPETEM